MGLVLYYVGTRDQTQVTRLDGSPSQQNFVMSTYYVVDTLGYRRVWHHSGHSYDAHSWTRSLTALWSQAGRDKSKFSEERIRMSPCWDAMAPLV